jgi:hypothetical protein
MWIWQKWTSSAALKQLRLQDAADPQATYLYKLSQEKVLEYFKTIILASSEQDLYAPFHSARIETPKEANNTKYGKLLIYSFLHTKQLFIKPWWKVFCLLRLAIVM